MSLAMNIRFVSAEENGTMNYAVYYPDNCEGLPLLVYLHGAGERGTAFDHLYRHGIPLLLEKGRTYPAIILVPQCPTEVVWCNIVDQVKTIIDKVAAEFSVLPDRICLTGSSMGGYGTWSTALTYPNFFSAIAPIAGGGMAWRAKRLVTTPVYAFHGAEDTVVVPVYSQLMCDAVTAAGGEARLVLLEGFEHDDGINYAYAETDMVDWLLRQRRTDFSFVPDACSQYY